MPHSMVVDTVKVAQTGFEWLPFIIDIASTAIGALLGFVFALVLFLVQQRHTEKKSEANHRQQHILALKRTVDTCGINVETLVNAKEQLIVPVANDAIEMRKALKTDDPQNILDAAPHLEHFFQGMAPFPSVPFPEDAEFFFALDDMPMFMLFVRRATASFELLAELISDRNRLVAEYARANGGPRGMTRRELEYFITMLASHAENIHETANDAIAFLMLVHDQAHNYGKWRLGDGKFRKFMLTSKHEFMPPDDYLPNYRKKFVDFSPGAQQ